MRLVGLVADEWAARLVCRLAEDGVDVAAVVLPTDDAARVWRGLRCPPPQRELAAGPDYDLAAADCGAILAVGRPSVPAAIRDASPSVRRLAVTAAAADGVAVTDPVHWCLRSGHGEIEVRLHRVDRWTRRGFGAHATLADTRVSIAGLDYRAAVAAVAEAVRGMLDDAFATSAAAPAASVPDGAAPAGRPAGDAAPVDALAIDRRMLRIDWTADAEAIVRLVQAASGRSAAAWTYLAGFPVTIGSARVIDGAGHNVPAGTVVARAAVGLTIQTGRGLVAIGEVRDAIGVVPHTAVATGAVLGLDVVEEVRSLRRRVADLERTVQWALRERAEPIR